MSATRSAYPSSRFFYRDAATSAIKWAITQKDMSDAGRALSLSPYIKRSARKARFPRKLSEINSRFIVIVKREQSIAGY